jgi:hypothetical protein
MREDWHEYVVLVVKPGFQVERDEMTGSSAYLDYLLPVLCDYLLPCANDPQSEGRLELERWEGAYDWDAVDSEFEAELAIVWKDWGFLGAEKDLEV